MNNAKGWILVIGLLLIFGITAFAIVWTVRQTIQQTVSPVQDMYGGLGTRVAQVMNPTPTILPDPVTIVRQVKAVARLETIQYEVEKVITAETGQGALDFLFGDRLIFVAHGTVIAGVDMAKISPQDMRLENGVLFVTLPETEIFIVSIDNQLSYVYDRDTGFLNRGDINLETNARRAAEQEIHRAAIEGGILEMAQNNAETYLYRLLRDLGYPEVVFVEREGTPIPSPPPFTPTP
jgi:hypothetical protein